ncbi:hypothetical protein AVEN_257299-1 [Araneus ventricosus]|uniref:Uncharacterized protein n=1 Tax=Araneus ventricosus TaxID=182803 RepID=A0A4Y2Q047_ARAVE|nr:hypothetical protein AVEN_257299-1 [Araneus ventricosus]
MSAKGLIVKLLKLPDVHNLLQKHFGSKWERDDKLILKNTLSLSSMIIPCSTNGLLALHCVFHFLAYAFKLAIHDRSTPRKSILSHLSYSLLPSFPISSVSKPPPYPHVPFPATFMARKSKWSDGYRDWLDIQPRTRTQSHTPVRVTITAIERLDGYENVTFIKDH